MACYQSWFWCCCYLSKSLSLHADIVYITILTAWTTEALSAALICYLVFVAFVLFVNVGVEVVEDRCFFQWTFRVVEASAVAAVDAGATSTVASAEATAMTIEHVAPNSFVSHICLPLLLLRFAWRSGLVKEMFVRSAPFLLLVENMLYIYILLFEQVWLIIHRFGRKMFVICELEE